MRLILADSKSTSGAELPQGERRRARSPSRRRPAELRPLKESAVALRALSRGRPAALSSLKGSVL
eukprot:8195540-Pyramimonas_sp.AAC.1